MPRETRLAQDIMVAVHANNIRDVRDIFESRIKRKDKFSFLCLNDSTDKLAKDMGAAILAAAKLKDTTILKYMLDSGAGVNFVGESPPNGKPSQVSPLHVSVSNGLVETSALLLQHNADVNKKDHHGRTPLHLAIKKCDCETVRMLLSRGADVNVTDGQHQTALQLAAKFGHVEMVRLLMEYQAQIFFPSQKGPSPIHLAAMHGHVPMVDIFTHYVDVNILVACSDGVLKAPLHLAAEKGHVETVRFMIERFGADVDRLDSNDQTALHSVLSRPHDHTRMRRKEDYDLTLELLLKSSSAINHQNKEGESALHLAAKHQFYKGVEMLLLAGADSSAKNKKQKTPRDCIPDHDLPMKQLFANFGVFSSPAVPSGIYPVCPCSPAQSMRVREPAPKSNLSANPAFVTTVKSENDSHPSAPTFD